MERNLLIVEDESGIREGLTSYLQTKGYGVVAAANRSEGLREIAVGDFDLVITDWHLGDGLGASIAAASECPVLVISGADGCLEIEGHADMFEVMPKPIVPTDLLVKIESMFAVDQVLESEAELVLPVDAQDRVNLVQAMIRTRHDIPDDSITVRDDGTYVTVQALLPGDDDELMEVLSKITGDVRCLDCDGKPLLEIKLFRSGQVQEEDCLVGLDEPWPEEQSVIGVDFSRADYCTPTRFLELVERVKSFRENGCQAYCLNVPTHLRLYLELFEPECVMPRRGIAGPVLPAALSGLLE
jgi:CheY-like chemotaxis protein